MLWLIKKLLLGKWCEHKWVEIGRGSMNSFGRRVGTYYETRCEKCGAYKVWNLR